MMLGGGFLKQAHDSFVKNRELRKEATKLSMKDSLSFKTKPSQSLSENDPIMSASARSLMVQEIKRENRRFLILAILISFAALILLVTLSMNIAKPKWLQQPVLQVTNSYLFQIRKIKIGLREFSDKLTVWDGGNNGTGDGKTSTVNFISGLYKSVPPLQMIFNLADMELPEYLKGKVATELQKMADEVEEKQTQLSETIKKEKGKDKK